MRDLTIFVAVLLGAVSISVAGNTPTKVGGLSFVASNSFSVSIVQYDEKGYHYSDGKSNSRHMNVFYVAKSLPFDGDIFDSGELRRSENGLKSGKIGKAFSIFGASRITEFRNLRVLDSLKVNEFESQNISFERSMLLSDDKYFYVISFHENEAEFKKTLVTQYPELFSFKAETNPSWNAEELSRLYRDFSARNRLPVHIEELNRSIDEIMNTMRIDR